MRTQIEFDAGAIDWGKGDGLVPAIVQDYTTRAVLMLGYMNREALLKTVASGQVTFFSRSRQTLWIKGETSGNHLELEQILHDCDQDALLILANPLGPTCHRNTTSCFWGDHVTSESGGLRILEQDIDDRMSDGGAESYTRSLLQAGNARIAQKVGEEAVEVVIESLGTDDERFLGEAADLLYHLLVLIRAKGLRLSDVESVLQSRRK